MIFKKYLDLVSTQSKIHFCCDLDYRGRLMDKDFTYYRMITAAAAAERNSFSRNIDESLLALQHCTLRSTGVTVVHEYCSTVVVQNYTVL